MLFSRKSGRSRPPRPSTTPRPRLEVEALEARVVPYALNGGAWGHPELVTISFVPDGTVLGSNANGYVYSNLFQTFNARFGSAQTWQREILRAAQSWAQQTNLNFDLVSDDGGTIGAGLYKQGDPREGDIRIGGYAFSSNYLAVAYLPPPTNDYAIAGDLQFNTSQGWNVGSTYDLFTVAAHEFGHALGLSHSSTSTAAMWASYNGVKSTLRTDDIDGIRALYSGNNARAQDANDTAAPNNTLAAATNLNAAISATTRTALVLNQDISTTADVDYFTFQAPTGTASTLKVNVQSAGQSLLTPAVTVYAADGTTVLATASSTGQLDGTTLTLTVNNVKAGQQFYVKVTAADSTPSGTGRYALALNFGTGTTPTAPAANTQTANGSSTQTGQGQADKLPLLTSLTSTVLQLVKQTGLTIQTVTALLNGSAEAQGTSPEAEALFEEPGTPSHASASPLGPGQSSLPLPGPALLGPGTRSADGGDRVASVILPQADTGPARSPIAVASSGVSKPASSSENPLLALREGRQRVRERTSPPSADEAGLEAAAEVWRQLSTACFAGAGRVS